MDFIYTTYYSSVIGTIKIAGSRQGITLVDFLDENETEKEMIQEVPAVINECIKQLDEYFNKSRKTFTVPIILEEGTDFQRKVWNKLREIPYGKTWTYKELAEAIGNNKASRAVGNANRKNRIAIIIPCHRVIGSSGNLVGYAGGLWRKEWLLKHEGCI